MSKCSFRKFSIKGTFKEVWPWATDLYCRMVYVESGAECFLICAFDSLGTWACDARKFIKAISESCNIPKKSIVFHELQAHAAPYTEDMNKAMDKIIERAIPIVNEMKATAKTFTCEVSEAYFGTECSFNREQYVEGLGGVTVWTGMRFDENEKPYAIDDKIMLLMDYRPKLKALEKPVYFDNQNDPLAYLFVFRDMDGNVIGTMSRFAAHPDVAVLFELRPITGKAEMYHYDFDWCGYLSTRLEEEFGGESIYLNGPCGDLSTKKGYDGIDDFESSDKECRRIGNWFAEKLIKSFSENRRVLKDSELIKTDTFKVTLPLRDDLPTSVDDALHGQGEKIASAKKAYEDALNDPSKHPYEVKRTIDDYYKARTNWVMAWQANGFTDEILKNRRVEIDIPCVRFGEYLFVGVPGESLVEMTTWLRSTFTGSKTIPLDQCNGYYGYMATPRTLTLGGYTYWSSWTNRDTIPELQKQIYPLINKFLD